MEFLNSIIHSTEINSGTILFRLALSFIAGAIIGFEREYHRQPAGLKTHMLISIGSTLLMLLSIYIPQTYQDFQNGDPGRIAAQVVSGIGFIGAGAILRMGINVRGLTTAASIWAIAAIGLAIGAGMYLPAIITVGLILIVLIVVEQIENYILTPLSIKILKIKTHTPDSDKQVREILTENHFRVIEINPSYEKENGFTYVYKIGSSHKTEWVKLSEILINNDPEIRFLDISDPMI